MDAYPFLPAYNAVGIAISIGLAIGITMLLFSKKIGLQMIVETIVFGLLAANLIMFLDIISDIFVNYAGHHCTYIYIKEEIDRNNPNYNLSISFSVVNTQKNGTTIFSCIDNLASNINNLRHIFLACYIIKYLSEIELSEKIALGKYVFNIGVLSDFHEIMRRLQGSFVCTDEGLSAIYDILHIAQIIKILNYIIYMALFFFFIPFGIFFRLIPISPIKEIGSLFLAISITLIFIFVIVFGILIAHIPSSNLDVFSVHSKDSGENIFADIINAIGKAGDIFFDFLFILVSLELFIIVDYILPLQYLIPILFGVATFLSFIFIFLTYKVINTNIEINLPFS